MSAIVDWWNGLWENWTFQDASSWPSWFTWSFSIACVVVGLIFFCCCLPPILKCCGLVFTPFKWFCKCCCKCCKYGTNNDNPPKRASEDDGSQPAAKETARPSGVTHYDDEVEDEEAAFGAHRMEERPQPRSSATAVSEPKPIMRDHSTMALRPNLTVWRPVSIYIRPTTFVRPQTPTPPIAGLPVAASISPPPESASSIPRIPAYHAQMHTPDATKSVESPPRKPPPEPFEAYKGMETVDFSRTAMKRIH